MKVNEKVIKHVGVLGMKWGRRQKVTNKKLSEFSPKKITRGKKILLELAIGGLTLAAFLMKNSGRIPASQEIIDSKFLR